MRFRPWPKPTDYEDTSRKRAAFARKQRLEREALPLFAAEIAEGQVSADDEMLRRAEVWAAVAQSVRSQRAENWRRQRARLLALAADTRRKLRSVWRECPYPADPSYLGDLLTQVERGKVDLDRPPWAFHAPLSARTTPKAKTFGEAFRRIGRRCAYPEGASPAVQTEILRGNLGSGILFLNVTRIRDCMRLDVEVSGECSDGELRIIERLARRQEPEGDVLVKRKPRTDHEAVLA